MSRPSIMTLAGLSATAALVLGALAVMAMVLAKGDRLSEASLDVSVNGVPGYVYVGQPYDITVEYTNSGAQATGPARVVIDMSGEHDFRVIDASDGGLVGTNHVEWALADIDGKSSGTLQFTVVATGAKDYSKADYNFPGYAGHAAFDDGFHFAARVERVSDTRHLASALLTADSGLGGPDCQAFVQTPCIRIIKEVSPATESASFDFVASNLFDGFNINQPVGSFNLGPFESRLFHYNTFSEVTIREVDDDGLINIFCSSNDVQVIRDVPTATVTIPPSSFTGGAVLCIFINAPREEEEPVRNVSGGVLPILRVPDRPAGQPQSGAPQSGAAPAGGTLGAPRTGDGGLASN